MSKTGRNDPCPCGSELKYKKCCLALEQPAPRRKRIHERENSFIAELLPEVDKAVDLLLERLEQGGGREVAAKIEELLKEHPQYHLTNYAMGVYLARVLSDASGAIPYFEKAIEKFPFFPEAHFNLGMAAQQVCDIGKAVAAFRGAERYSNDDGIAKIARDQLQELESILRKTTSFRTLDAYAANAKLFEEAFQCLADRKYEKAAQLFNRVLSEHPTHVQSYGNLALAYAGLGRKAAAMECFDKALALDPGYEPAISNRLVTEQVREGEPFIPKRFKETEYYRERLQRESIE